MSDSNSAQLSYRVWTIPNLLSFLRLVLVPVFLICVINGEYLWALLILIYSSVSDYLDGFIARKFNQMSRLGQLLDPAADRLYIFAALLGLLWQNLLPLWLVLLIVARDVTLLIAGLVLFRNGYGPLAVHHLGKAATLCLLYAIPIIMLGQVFAELAPVSAPIGWAFALWGAFLYWWAGIIYWIQTFRLVRSGQSSIV